ncbi:hypothetical protein OSTOST_15843, partial [Ostertagia ostertagi]
MSSVLTSVSTSASKFSDNYSCNESTYSDLLERLGKEESLPSYVKFIIGVLVDTKEELSELNRRCNAILVENQALRNENDSLKSQLRSLLSTVEASDSKAVCSCPSQSIGADDRKSPEVDTDLKRSIVVAGVPESQLPGSADRVRHDLHCVSTLLNFLDVECLPCHVFRMGVKSSSQPRLLKVVLPSGRFQRQVIKRAPRLRFFPHGRVFVRPSLTKEERTRRREVRQAGSVCLDSSVVNGSERVSSADRSVVALLHKNYDLVLITETWLHSKHDTDPLLGIVNSQYDVLRCDRLYKKGGGVLILVRNSLSYNIVYKDSLKDAYEILVVDLFVYQSNFRLFLVYRTPLCNSQNSGLLLKLIKKKIIESKDSTKLFAYITKRLKNSKRMPALRTSDDNVARLDEEKAEILANWIDLPISLMRAIRNQASTVLKLVE